MCHFEVILKLHLPNWSHIWSRKRRKQFILHQNSSLTDAYIVIIDSFSLLPVKMSNSEDRVAWKGVNVERQGKGSQVTHQTYRFNLRCLCITQKDSILQSHTEHFSQVKKCNLSCFWIAVEIFTQDKGKYILTYSLFIRRVYPHNPPGRWNLLNLTLWRIFFSKILHYIEEEETPLLEVVSLDSLHTGIHS